ncbi:phage gp6-like head-tail connector protein [Streptomyces hygroscopicus subsp. hygroscopicus]|uniref:phage gp6-like head-tail connector protein n=1 Tax=Streptomyces hygroscopicus TaxID=1912 RepID=UPI001C65754A|nr:phage gp6-like head-tail connector protein [Streptomyces hygroscopicus]MBW8087758.1 phage gp6-like head-tail connector protein [Streptomyces hygroscopicus subsp. hygroscopicus]
MAQDYTDLATLKLALNATDSTRDDLLNMAIAAASRGIDRNTGRRFWLDATASVRTYNPQGRTVCGDSGELLIVDDIGSATGLAVAIGSVGTDYETVTDYETQPDNALARGEPITGLLRPAGTWGRGVARVRITALWGWPAVPDEIAQATAIQALRLYKRKDSPEGILGSAEWGAVRMGRVDPDVYELTKHFVLPGF